MRVTEGVAASHKLALALKQHTNSLVARTPPVASRASPLAEGALDIRFIVRSTVALIEFDAIGRTMFATTTYHKSKKCSTLAI